MANIMIRNLDDDVTTRLRVRAGQAWWVVPEGKRR